MASENSWAASDGEASQAENEQKLRVFTEMVCSSHGSWRGVIGSSMGRTTERVDSSEAFSCQTRNLLSRPCLECSSAR
jgi:hypothetical protein